MIHLVAASRIAMGKNILILLFPCRGVLGFPDKTLCTERTKAKTDKVKATETSPFAAFSKLKLLP